MPKLGYYEAGSWNAVCDICGRGFKFNQLSLAWDNTWRDPECWEIRQPQDFVRGIKDDMSIPIARPRVFPANFSPAIWHNSDGTVAYWYNSNTTPAVWAN